jgi:GNAT superfamily N-acetyltransferase
MTGATDRPYGGERDLERAIDLLVASRIQANKDRAPTTKRLTLLVTSRLWDPAQDAHIWEVGSGENAADGQIAGVALLWRREEASPHLSLELVTSPSNAVMADMGGALAHGALRWAMSRAAALAEKMNSQVSLSVATFEDQQQLQALLLRSGFVVQEGHNVYMSCALDNALPSPGAPADVTIRPLLGDEEIARYTSLYSFTPMSANHRLELLHDSDYVHLVALGPRSDFIAFCECSIDRGEWARGGRQTGWVEYMGVRENLRGRGLGRAVVSAGLRWLRSHGAQTAALITVGTNITARRMYSAVGFSVSERDYSYTRSVDPSNQPAS